MFCGSGGSTSRLAKAVGAEAGGQMRDEKLHPFVVRSTVRSKKYQKLTGSDHFWNLRCQKSARHCGAKHTYNCTHHYIYNYFINYNSHGYSYNCNHHNHNYKNNTS